MTRRRTLIAGVGVVLALLVLGARGDKDGSWVAVEQGDLLLGVPVEGELEAIDSVQLGPPAIERFWGFQISRLLPEGTEVEADEPVLWFDTTQLEKRLHEKRGEAASAAKELEKLATDLDVERRGLELQLEEARARLRRADLKASGTEEVTAAAELEKAAIDRRLAALEITHLEASLEQQGVRESSQLSTLERKRDEARAAVTRLERDIENMTVKAPRAGVLVVKGDWNENKYQVGDQVWRAAKVVEIPDLAAMRAVGEVDEANAGRVSAGQGTTLRLDAFPDREYGARVALIRRTVQKKSRDQPAKIVKLTLELAEVDTERMRPGMRYRGLIETERLEDTVLAPTGAVLADADGSYVVRKTLFGRRKLYPALGRRNARFVEVLDGLDAGDRILQPSAESAS